MNTATETKTVQEQLRFQLEFMALMLMAGRNEEADIAFKKALALTSQIAN